MTTEQILWLLPLPPLLAFVVIILFTNKWRALSFSIAVAAAAISWFGSMVVFFNATLGELAGRHLGLELGGRQEVVVLPVHLPSLKERVECIEPLSLVLLKKGCEALKKKITGFKPMAMEIIKSYDWPGNIRQLTNTIERAIILEEIETIGPESISIPNFHTPTIPPGSYEPLAAHEKELILKALKDNLWVQKNAARRLGISPRALNYKVKKFEITHPNWRKNR